MDLLVFIHVADPTKVGVKRLVVMDASGSSHPPKKLKKGHVASSEVATGGKSLSALRELMASSLLNIEGGVKAVVTLPFVTSSVSATPEREDDNPTDSVTRDNFCAIGPAERFIISLDSFHHSGTHASGVEVASVIRYVVPLLVIIEALITTTTASIPSAPILKTSTKVNTLVHASMFHDSNSVRPVKLDVAGPSYLPGKELFLRSREVDFEHLQEAMEKIHADEIETLKKINIALDTERISLDRKVTKLQPLVSTKDLELKGLNASLSSLRSQNDGLVYQVHALEATCFGLCKRLSGCENLTDWLEEFQDAQLKVVNDKVAKLDEDLVEMACHLEEKFYPHLLTTISSHSLRSFINRAIEKGMQDGFTAGIDHGREGRILTDVAAYSPSAEAEFNSALQELREIDFPLLSELKSHKDTSVEDIMNLLRLEGPLVDAPGMVDMQPDIEQLKVPIYRSEDQVVLRETSLSFALSVSHSRVEQIKASIAVKRSALLDV
nr:hypothetical protein [Tanacetum cinerariifolium]